MRSVSPLFIRIAMILLITGGLSLVAVSRNVAVRAEESNSVSRVDSVVGTEEGREPERDNLEGENKGEADVSCPLEIVGVRVGIGGYYKNGFVTPVRVRLRQDGTAPVTTEFLLQLESIDSDGTPVYHETRVLPDSFPEKGGDSSDSPEITIPLYFSSGRANAPLIVRLLDPISREIFTERSFTPKGDPTEIPRDEESLFPEPVYGSRPVWLTLGGDFDGVATFLKSLQLPENRVPSLVRGVAFSDLPWTSEGLDAVDLILISASDPAFYEGISPDSPEMVAIRDWMERGGKVALFGGSGALPLLSGEGLFASFVPGTVQTGGLRELRQVPALIQYVPKAKNLVMLGSLDSPYLSVPVLGDLLPEARLELTETETPLLVRSPQGMGTILFFAADPDQLPLSRWDGRNALLMKIFASDVDQLTGGGRDSGLMKLGYDDLSGQLRSALDRFDGVRNIPFSAILGLIFLYVVTIGPVDWFLNHRVFKRPNLTWLTLPIWFLLFSWTAYALNRSFHPNRTRINRVDLIDFDLASETIRGTSWTGFYSSSDLRRDLTLQPVIPESFRSDRDFLSSEVNPQIQFSWLGLMGDGLGGMDSKAVLGRPWSKGYRIAGGILEDLPVPVRSTKSLMGRWFFHVSQWGSVPKGEIKDEEGILSGTIWNPIGAPLENAVLYYDHQAFLIGSFPTGENRIEGKSFPKVDEVERVLSGVMNPFALKLSGSDYSAEWSPYSADSVEPDAILRLLSFYRLVGGMKGNALTNAQQTRLDASDLYSNGRAVLMGTLRSYREGSETPLPPLRTDLGICRHGDDVETPEKVPIADHHAVYVRFFIPVTRVEKENSK